MKTAGGETTTMSASVEAPCRAPWVSVSIRPMRPEQPEAQEDLTIYVSRVRAEVFTVGRGLTRDIGEIDALGDAKGR